MQGKPMPKGLSLAGQLAYQAIAHLYARYKLKTIKKEDATQEKRIIKVDYDALSKSEELLQRRIEWYAKAHIELEQAVTEYRKAKTEKEWLSAADKIVSKLDGIPFFSRR